MFKETNVWINESAGQQSSNTDGRWLRTHGKRMAKAAVVDAALESDPTFVPQQEDAGTETRELRRTTLDFRQNLSAAAELLQCTALLFAKTKKGSSSLEALINRDRWKLHHAARERCLFPPLFCSSYITDLFLSTALRDCFSFRSKLFPCDGMDWLAPHEEGVVGLGWPYPSSILATNAKTEGVVSK